MSRLRYNGLATGSAGSLVALSLGGSLTSSATSVTFNAALTYQNGTAVPTIASPDILPLSLLDSTGSFVTEVVYLTAYTSAGTTGTIARGQEGFTGVAHASGDKIVHAATVSDVGGALAYAAYNPGTISAYTTTSTTAVDVDATNLAVTFIVPPSGKVLVTLSALGGFTASPSGQMDWLLRNGSTTVAGSDSQIISVPNSNNQQLTAHIAVTGLTAGASLTYKWGWLVAGTSPSGRVYAGGVAGQAVMKVETLP